MTCYCIKCGQSIDIEYHPGCDPEINRIREENRKLKEQKFSRFANEECWIYQGDGEDHLESLVCPVVISAQQLIDLTTNHATAQPDMDEIMSGSGP